MSKPNLVIFNPDQFRGDALGHVGDPGAQTPNLDRFASADGVSFRHAFCQLPVCTPSRCSFMSGWYPHVRGHRSQLYMMRPGEPVLLKTLKDHGYHVWWGGKNDLVPAQHGYDDYCTTKAKPVRPEGKRLVCDWPENWRGEPDGPDFYSFYVGKLEVGPGETYWDSDWGYVEAALRFIREWDSEQPFCLYLPLGYPHPPYAVEDPWYSAIDRNAIPPRRPAPEGKAGILEAMIERHRLEDQSEAWWRELRAVYYGMCSRIDHQFGLIVEALKEAGLYDETGVFFFSDHGDFTGDYGLVNKTYNALDDNLTRVPFLIKPPASLPVRPGVREALVELVDFPATVFAMTGIEPDWQHFGRSLLPVIAGEAEAHRDAVFSEGGRLPGERMWDQHHYEQHGQSSLYWPTIDSLAMEEPRAWGKATMCRTHDYKYVHRLYERDELYDLRVDPQEACNRIEDPELAPVLAELKDRTMRFYLETTDVLPPDLDQRA